MPPVYGRQRTPGIGNDCPHFLGHYPGWTGRPPRQHRPRPILTLVIRAALS